MKKRLVTYTLLITGFLGFTNLAYCQFADEKIIRIEYDFEKAGSLKMSEIISEINYIPLEKNPKCQIGYMWIYAFDKDILVKSHGGNESIYRFTKQGKFLNKIGRRGRGPNEYEGCSDVFLNGDLVYVISNFTNSVLCYSLAGDFLNRYKIDSKYRPKNVIQLPDKSYMISLSTMSKPGFLIKTDNEFNIQTGYFKNFTLTSNPLPNRFQKSNNKIFYFNHYHDTIYDISKGTPSPAIVIDYGKYRTSNKKLSIDPKNNVILNRPSIHDFNSSDNYIKLNFYYPFKGRIYSALYRISDGKQFAWSKLINDVDNGTLDRWSGILSKDNLVFHLMPSTILDRFENMTKEERLNPTNSAFIEMASKISPDSNPVIMVCKLK